MSKRQVIKLIGIIGLISIGFNWLIIKEIIQRIFVNIAPKNQLPPENERNEYHFVAEGDNISVETILNSRCTSDYDGHPKIFHWGLFDRNSKLTKEQISTVTKLSQIPRLTQHRMEITINGNMLTYSFDNHIRGIERDWLMIESGMQQQATGLVCCALGVGMVFRNLGKNGSELNKENFATVRIKVEPMLPTYDGSYWNDKKPFGRKPWLTGNLPDPDRGGRVPLLKTIAEVNAVNYTDKKASKESLGQLLWAARGRTPHYYKSKPWGMTIPTWGGEEVISEIYVIYKLILYKYINWHSEKDRPTHSIKAIYKLNRKENKHLAIALNKYDNLIIFATSDEFARAHWEIGYQLLNIILQAKVLNIYYDIKLFNKKRRTELHKIGIKNALVGLAI